MSGLVAATGGLQMTASGTSIPVIAPYEEGGEAPLIVRSRPARAALHEIYTLLVGWRRRTGGGQMVGNRVISAVIVVALATVAAGCGTKGDQTARRKTATDEAPKTGGTLVLGAQQEPGCADPMSTCGGSIWAGIMMGRPTLPHAFDLPGGQYRPSDLLAGEPVVEAGPPQRVTYRLNSRAVWSDGVPITSSDFKYTWEQGKAARVAGLADIAGVDDTDPTAAVATWAGPAANWRDRFGLLLPSHLLRGKDRTAELKDGYGFSGGPWLIDHWTKGLEVKLVRNPRYWGRQPNLDAVVFKIIPDAAAYLQAFKTGQLDMVLVQGAQPEVAELKDLPNTEFDVESGLAYDFVMFNTTRPPLDSKAVRQALGYASDREAIVRQLAGALDPGAKPSQAFSSPANRDWYSEPFAKYRRDLGKVNDLMRADGWTRGADGIWAKGGTRARIELTAATGNRRRELTEEILQSQWKEAGFETGIDNTTAAALGDRLSKGDFGGAVFGNFSASPDPNLCAFFCSRLIPTEANTFSGSAWSRITDPALDAAIDATNEELDPQKRKDLVRRAQELLADLVPALPLAAVPDVYAANSAKVGGPVSAVPAFSRMNEWFCKSCS